MSVDQTYGLSWKVDYNHEPQSNFDTPPFQDYKNAIEEIIFNNDGVGTAEIHAVLGTDKRHWTLDAISMIDCEPVQRGGRQVYKMREWHARNLHTNTTNPNGMLFTDDWHKGEVLPTAQLGGL